MTTPSLEDVLPGATQTGTSVTIPKANLPTLTADLNNNGQEILVALLLAAKDRLNTEARDADPDTKVTIAYGGQTILPTATTGQNSQQDTFTVVLYKDVAAADIDADDY